VDAIRATPKSRTGVGGRRASANQTQVFSSTYTNKRARRARRHPRDNPANFSYDQGTDATPEQIFFDPPDDFDVILGPFRAGS
jgi:hypothetical protein